MEAEEPCEPLAELEAAFAVAGVSVSRDQMERWRGKGLLPKVRQVGRGRSTGGSDIRYPAGTARQALAIVRLLRGRRKLDQVGWALWMQGFPVDESHWRIPLESMQRFIFDTRNAVRGMVARDENSDADRTIFDNIDIGALRDTPLGAAFGRLSPDLLATAKRIAADIFLGRFRTFDAQELPLVKSVLGIAASVPAIGGQRLNYDEIERVLPNLSIALGGIKSSGTLSEPPLEIRRELADTQSIAINLYHSTKWRFKGGLNLRTIERILAGTSIEMQAAMLLVWVRYRAVDNQIANSHAIAEMAVGGRNIRQFSEQLQFAISELPLERQVQFNSAMRKIIRRKR